MDLDICWKLVRGGIKRETHTKENHSTLKGLWSKTCNLPIVYKMCLIINDPIANDKWCMAENGKMLYYSQKSNGAY